MTAAIDRLFKLMCEEGASDLHLSVGMPPLIRKDGSIQVLDLAAPPLDSTTMTSLIEPIMPGKNKEEFARRHDTDFAYEITGLARFRANVFMDRKGPGAVFRVIPSKILTAADLLPYTAGIRAQAVTRDGTLVQLWTCTGATNQKWARS